MDEVTELKNRLQLLKALKSFLKENDESILDSLSDDLSRNTFDSYSAEILHLNNELNFAIKNLKSWQKKTVHKSAGIHWPNKIYSKYIAHGKILIVSPWNYPIYLALSPLISALAAGNKVVLKPSELAPKSSRLLFEKLNAYLPKEEVEVVIGDYKVAQELLMKKWDFIFFTGGIKTGEIYRSFCAREKIPCVLELGGKNPVFFDSNFSEIFIKRLLWAKFFSSGQTCIAPDYLWIPRSEKENFINQIKLGFDKMLCGDWQDLVLSNESQKNRWKKTFENNEEVEWVVKKEISNAKDLLGGIAFVKRDSRFMQEEVFGPFLPVLIYDDIDDALEYTKNISAPLAVYSFSENSDFNSKIEMKTKSGAFVENGVMTQIMSVDAPFGGVAESGIGRARGYEGFKSFSQLKTIVKRSSKIDLAILYPPYKVNIKWLKKALR